MAGLDGDQLAHLRNWLAGMAGVSKPDFLVMDGADLQADVLEAVRARVKPASTPQVGRNPKPPAPPYFSGKNVIAGELRGWLSTMKLQWAQLKPHDETLFALMYLSEDAAVWRDVQLTPAHGGTTGIPTAVFEAEPVQQFIPMTVALQADREFAQIRQKQGVDHYNMEYVMAGDELAVMPHVQQPDVSTTPIQLISLSLLGSWSRSDLASVFQDRGTGGLQPAVSVHARFGLGSSATGRSQTSPTTPSRAGAECKQGFFLPCSFLSFRKFELEWQVQGLYQSGFWSSLLLHAQQGFILCRV